MSIVLLPSGSFSLFFFFFAVVCMWVSMYISFLFLHFLRFAFFFSSPFFTFTYTSASHTTRKKLFHFYVKKYGTLLHIDVSLTHGKYGVLKPLFFFFFTVAFFFFFCLFPITIFRFCTLYLFLFYSGFSNTLC